MKVAPRWSRPKPLFGEIRDAIAVEMQRSSEAANRNEDGAEGSGIDVAAGVTRDVGEVIRADIASFSEVSRHQPADRDGAAIWLACDAHSRARAARTEDQRRAGIRRDGERRLS